jgi:hypothetical protein
MGYIKRRWIEEMQPKEEPPVDIVSRIEALLANTPAAEIEEFEVTRCLRDCRDEIIAARACAEMMLQGTGQPLAERMAKRVLDDITDAFAGVPQWIPVSERLPEDYDMVILTDSDWVTFGCWSAGCGYWNVREDAEANGPRPLERFTHWMPLPEPPEAK